MNAVFDRPAKARSNDADAAAPPAAGPKAPQPAAKVAAPRAAPGAVPSLSTAAANTVARQRPAPAPLRESRDLPAKRPQEQTPQFHWPLIWTVFVSGVLWLGYQARLERYITPQRGIGYWLGIIGGSMMVLLLLYSARKRAAWLRWLGGIAAWFEIHMILGVVGPVLVLFHSNFRLGATNSNVALISMLLVAGSGVIGRYVYTRLHATMDSKEESLEQLKAVGERLRAQTTSLAYLPGLVEAVERVEQQLIIPPKGQLLRLLHLSTGALRITLARWVMRREIARALTKVRTVDRPRAARHGDQIAAAARSYANRRLNAGRRLHEYQLYAQIFSLWHVLHIPLFFMLLIAGIVHVIAVNIY
jgi:hypothetical protein